MLSNKKMALVALCLTLLGASSAYAQSTAYAQDSSNYNDQLALDVTMVPAGSGAIFVPSLSNPDSESRVSVFYNGDKVAVGKTGQRIVVPPGNYDVVMGAGNRDDAAKTSTRVVEGSTVVLQPFYGGVEIVAVDPDGHPLEESFGIIQNDHRVIEGETVKDNMSKSRTYLLQPGPKSLEFSDGSTIAFDVPRGGKVTYRAVFDGEKFVELKHADGPLKAAKEKWWRARWTIGADLSFTYATKQISDFTGMAGQLGVFTQAEVGVDYNNNLFTLKLGLDESWIMIDSKFGAKVPIRSMRDQLKGELFYAYRAWHVLGPFVRVTADTSAFWTNYYSKGGKATLFVDENKNPVPVQSNGGVGNTDSFPLLKPFAPLFVEEAAGINLTLVDNSVFDFLLLGGVAARQHFFRSEAYYVVKEEDSGNTTTVTVKKLKKEKLYGAMAEARIGLRIGRAFRISAVGKMFVPYQQIPGVYKLNKKNPKVADFDPIYSVSGLAEFAINSWASLVYRGEWIRPTTQVKVSMYHGASLRIQHNLF